MQMTMLYVELGVGWVEDGNVGFSVFYYWKNKKKEKEKENNFEPMKT